MWLWMTFFASIALTGALQPLWGPAFFAPPNEIPQDVVRATMKDVAAILRDSGYDVGDFENGDAPTVRVVPCRQSVTLKRCLRSGAWLFSERTIEISDREAEDCRQVTLAYELTRYAAQSQGLTEAFSRTQPNTVAGNLLVMLWETELAKAVAAAYAEDPYRPNCLPGRAHAENTP